MKVSWTIYRQVGEKSPEGVFDHASAFGRVGLDIAPMPSATLEEVVELADALRQVADAMDDDWTEARSGSREFNSGSNIEADVAFAEAIDKLLARGSIPPRATRFAKELRLALHEGRVTIAPRREG